MEKFDLLVKVLSDLQDAGILKYLVLVGSWCQDFYRYQYGNPEEIPATKTMDADILIPRRMPKVNPPVDIVAIMKKNDFIFEIGPVSGLYKFNHPQLKVEFLTDPGAKPDEVTRHFKELGVTAQELHFMSLPMTYHYPLKYKHLTINIPEPEVFAVHKLIVCQRRTNKEKAEKDRLTAQGMFLFFKGKPHHIKRLHQIIGEQSKSWQKKIKAALEKTGLELPQ
ncbi:MAG: GSU2403 family nucleotidyltransferase fold protein [Chitinivibrionales bacterium]|nr:GSU2403 family nucleotidyltransferase fold protein [Chitinivibrionales bacterium]